MSMQKQALADLYRRVCKDGLQAHAEEVCSALRQALASAPDANEIAARCEVCNYQHGHQIGCTNNPMDIALKAAAGTPVAWWYDVAGNVHLHRTQVDHYYCLNDEYIKGKPLVFADAPQATPLTHEQKWEMWTAATIEQPSARGCYFRGVEDAEAKHGIK